MAADGVARDAPSADDVAAATVRVGEPRLVDGLVHWLRSAPDGSGDMLLVRESPAGPQRCSAPGRSLRSALYGYGASAWAPTAAGPVGIEARTRALVRVGTERHEPLCAPREGAALGDPVELPGTDWVLAVEADATTCRLIAVSVVDGRRVEVLEVDGRAAEPQPSPDGRTLAWLRWPRRRMPWDAAEVWVGTLDVGRDGVALRRRRRLDGGEGASAGQPTWRGDGALAYVTEAAGHWQPYVCDDGGAVRRLSGLAAEFQRPRWLTCRWLAALGDDGALACALADGDGEHVGVLEPDGQLAMLDQPCVRVDGVAADAHRLAWVGATTATQGACLAATRGGTVRPIVVPAAPATAPVPERRSVVHDGRELDVVLWCPTARRGPVPLVVQVHPGPTGAVDRSYAGVVHLLCARGFAVAAVDTSGSTGHGRLHRERLLGRFGELDVAEVATVARALADAGVADARGCFVRGTSAGGTTALLALATGAFAGAVAWYPASSFVDDEDGFEEGYLAALTGTDGAGRLPLAVAATLRGAVLLVQGDEDPIVPRAETEALLTALRTARVDAECVIVAGEGHGFRTRAGRASALGAELAFYERVALGVTGAAPVGRYDATTPPSVGGTE